MEIACEFFHYFKCVHVCVSELIQPISLSTYFRPGIFLGIRTDGDQDKTRAVFSRISCS